MGKFVFLMTEGIVTSVVCGAEIAFP